VRACAGTTCPALAWLPEGASVELLPGTPAGGWLAVRSGDLAGWVYSDFLRCNP
jgi:uncharacterized protein YraI